MKMEVSSLPSGSLYDNVMTEKADLYNAFSKGEWDTVERFFGGEYELEAFTARLTESGQTGLLVAIKAKRGVSFIQKLIQLLPPELLDLTDYDGNTALHAAVDSGDADIVQLIVNKNPKLLNFHNKNGQQPSQLAEGKQRPPADPVTDDLSLSWCKEVRKAVGEGDGDGDVRMIEHLVDRHGTKVFTARLVAESGMTALHLAVWKKANKSLFKQVVDWMPRELLALTDYNGYTALHHAVMVGNEEAAKLLVETMPELLNFFDKDCCLPIQLASKEGEFKMASMLVSVGIEDKNCYLLEGAAGVRAMKYLVYARYYDLALKLFDKNPRLALERIGYSDLKAEEHPELENVTAFQLIAEDPAAFPSGKFFATCWDSLVYFCQLKIPKTLFPILMGILAILAYVPNLQSADVAREEKKQRRDVIQLVRRICQYIKKSEIETAEASSFLEGPFLSAAQNGIHEIVTQILELFPHALNFKDKNKHSIFHFAAMYRDEKMLDIARRRSTEDYKKFPILLDNKRNNILHLAAQKAPQDRLILKPQPILQMQSEIQWFKEIQEIVGPLGSKAMNIDKKTPGTLFNEEHAELVKTETKWVTSMASASSVVASLIATAAFTSAITVPGGNQEGNDKHPDKNGLPNFAGQPSFILFAASDGIALFTSIASVLTFLSIFTYRYGPYDFEFELPRRLIIGLIFLTLSVINLTIAFGSTLFLVFANKNALGLIPIITSACILVFLYVLVQVSSLFSMIKSTFFNAIWKYIRNYVTPALTPLLKIFSR